MQPAIRHNFSRFFGPVVITFHDAWPPGYNFAIVYFNGQPGQCLSGSADPDFSRTGESDHRSGFGHAESFHDVEADSVEKSPYFLVQRSSPGNHVLQMTTKSFVYLFEDGFAQLPVFGFQYEPQ